MAKQKKKRTKKYTGKDAAMTKPNVVRVQAVSRSRVGQWWFDRKRILKPIITISLVILVVVVVIIEVVSLIRGA